MGNLPDKVVSVIRDVDAAVAIDVNTRREAKRRHGCRNRIRWRIIVRSIAGYGADNSIQGYFADTEVLFIRYVNVACPVQGNIQGGMELGQFRRSAVPIVSPYAGTGNRGDDAPGIYLADTMVGPVSKIEGSIFVHG